MAEILRLSYTHGDEPVLRGISLASPFVKRPWGQVPNGNFFSRFRDLVSYLFSKGNNESDNAQPTVIVLDDEASTEHHTSHGLDALSYADKSLLIRYFFNHLNVIVVDITSLEKEVCINLLNDCIVQINKLINDRITRVQTWTGTGVNSVNDHFDREYDQCKGLDFKIDEIMSTMLFVLAKNLNTTNASKEKIISLKNLIMDEVDFRVLLTNHTPLHLGRLCHLVGHWSFPAHELSNDDLIYCVYVMLRYSLDQLATELDIEYPNENELLGFVFMVRDTYKNGNPFHNFRHAVDVLQACFHYLIRLHCLPPFEQFETDPNADELRYLGGDAPVVDSTTLVAKRFTRHLAHLNSIQTFGLLIAALGHDVGHPGVTNAFMMQHDAPTSLIYNERSVLELFHALVFINKILTINWPAILKVETDVQSKLTFKQLITSCILATDMAEHFEYLDKLTTFKVDSHKSNKVRLISSILIKCADISNVTRPIRVSAQWALVLSREFEEVGLLEQKIANPSVPPPHVAYDKLPVHLDEVLQTNPLLHNSQIFFITTFAENLFNNIVDLLPELQYTCDIIKENKAFWVQRKKSV